MRGVCSWAGSAGEATVKQIGGAETVHGEAYSLPRSEKQIEIGEWYWLDEAALARIHAGAAHSAEADENEVSINIGGLDLEIEGARGDDEEIEDETDAKPTKWLGAVTRVGSNYALLQGFAGSEYDSYHVRRVHFDIFDVVCTPEPNAEAIIAGNAMRHAENAQALMERVQDITRRLGVTPRAEIGDGSGGETQALALRGGGQSIDKYKQDLINAKTDQVPALFKQIERENKIAAGWMTARLISIKAKAEALRPAIKAIENRIFSVEIYAGLKEKVVQIADGEPAPVGTKISLMQRRCYMDEECLAQYEAGGMDYRDIRDFDAWLARPVNRDRILPLPRCVVAFRIRRYDKERDACSISDFIRIFQEKEADKQTYLYIRNGERLFRLKTAIDFGEDLFPELDRLDTSQMMYVKRDRSRDRDFLITEGAYIELVEQDQRHEASMREVTIPQDIDGSEDEDNDGELGAGGTRTVHVCLCNEHQLKRKRPGWFSCHYSSKAAEYEPYTPESVYYDDASDYLREEQEKHNRLVLVIQGLLDRSPVFDPHPQWKIWTPEGFSAGLHLVHDSRRAITLGEAPDFEAYRARLNKSLKVGSVTLGQELAWEEREAARENARQARDWRIRNSADYKRFRPHNNPGPGRFARVAAVSKQKVTYRWMRKKLTGRKVWVPNPKRPGWGHDEIVYDDMPDSIVVPTNRVLNVDAYAPGDFHQFFDDPRTRAMYIKWAPLLLAAEDYHGGKVKERRTDPKSDGSLRCPGFGHEWTSGNTKKGDTCDCGETTWEANAFVDDAESDDD